LLFFFPTAYAGPFRSPTEKGFQIKDFPCFAPFYRQVLEWRPRIGFGYMDIYYAKKLLSKETMNILPLKYVKIRVGRCRRVVRSGLRLSRPNPTPNPAFYVFLVVTAISSHWQPISNPCNLDCDRQPIET